MKKTDLKEIINYWQVSAERDYETMLGLFQVKRYPESLFFGHLALEKILKAFVVQETQDHAPPIHNLIRLIELTKTTLEEEEMNILTVINKFNIKSRYPDYKLKFYQECTFEYSNNYINSIKIIYKKICQKLKQSM